jgi:6-phosphogluconolactonase
MIAYVGTYSLGSDSEGIYRFEYDVATGKLSNRTLAAKADNPSFLAIDTARRLVTCVNETDNYQEKPTGAVSTFSIATDLSLDHRDTVPSEGRAPCYVSLCGDQALVANYNEGTVSALRVTDSLQLQLLNVKTHHGTGPNSDRQKSAHAHSITPLPNGKFAVAADLGTDELIIYALREDGLTQHAVVKETPGAGPRHVAFSKCGTRLFLLNELNGTLSMFRLDQDRGKLEMIATVSTLPDGWSGDNLCADIHLSPDGQFVYCSNRGHESLAVFRFDSTNDSLDRVQLISCDGEHPRNFAISPDGRFLLCANQNTHGIVTFAIDPMSGKLTPTGEIAEVPMPVCVVLVDDKEF